MTFLQTEWRINGSSACVYVEMERAADPFPLHSFVCAVLLLLLLFFSPLIPAFLCRCGERPTSAAFFCGGI